MHVVLDSSALMMPVELDVRLFDELDRVVGDVQRTSASESSRDATPTETDTPAGESDSVTDTDDGVETSGYVPMVPEAVVEELRKLADEGGLEGTAASVGYDLAVDRCERVDTTASYADDALVELAADGRADAVVTNDQPLRERVLDADVPVIALRGTNKLDITRP